MKTNFFLRRSAAHVFHALSLPPRLILSSTSLAFFFLKKKNKNKHSGGKKLKYHPPRFMTATHTAKQLLEVEASKKLGAYGADTTAVALARVGAEDQAIVVATLGEFAAAGEAEEAAAREEAEAGAGEEGGEPLPGVASAAATAAADALLKRPLGGPLHSLVIAGEIHSVEAELLDTFR